MSDIETRYRQVKDRIAAAARAAGRDPASITLIAVSKKQPVDRIEALYRLGHRDFGENYVQEMAAKSRDLEARGCSGIRWHFIGHLQTNKARQVVQVASAVHSVDSLKVAQALSKAWAASGRTGALPVFLEVNISREESKSGVPAQEAEPLARAVAGIQELSLQGMMCVPSVDEDEEGLRRWFKELRELDLECCDVSLHRLSMGMSGDFELAIAEGATHVRVGTALFGARS